MKDILINAAAAVLIAVISAFVTVKLSLRRFYSEKWWERKAKSYESIMEALHHMKKYCDEQVIAAIEDTKISETREQELEKRRKDAADEVSKAIDIGSFIISDEAVQLLSGLDKELHKAREEETFWEFLDVQSTALGKTLPKLREIARKDLEVK